MVAKVNGYPIDCLKVKGEWDGKNATITGKSFIKLLDSSIKLRYPNTEPHSLIPSIPAPPIVFKCDKSEDKSESTVIKSNNFYEIVIPSIHGSLGF